MSLNALPSVLCQPDATKSCGACCGMYNRAGEDAGTTLARLRERTTAYHQTASVHDTQSLEAFRAQWEPLDGKLVGGLPNCPFLGFVNESKVGCLVHPLQNSGVDGRDCGVYDRHTCEDYLCAAHSVLRPIERWLVVRSGLDTYTYGLVVTDPTFVRELFERTATINGAMPSSAHVMSSPQAALPYFMLKRDFPFRADDGVLGRVHGSEDLDTPTRRGPSAVLGVEPDCWETILCCVGCEVHNDSELEEARSIVSAAVHEFAREVASARAVDDLA